MRRFAIAAGLLLALPSMLLAQTGFSVTGGLSNFDCGNHCDDPCDEFEIEIEGIHPEDVIHTYRNGNYGAPTITLSTDGLKTIIDYRHPAHLTAVNAIEHFGVSLRQLSAFNPIRVRWMKNGAPATVNGRVPVQGGGTAPATQPMLPSITADMGTGSGGNDGVSLTVTNNDAGQAIWIKRRASVTLNPVSLEALMPNDPVVTTSVQIDPAPIYLAAGSSITVTSDLVEIEDNQTAVFSAEYFQDIFAGGLFNSTHTIGPALGNVMTATIASPDTGCANSSPVIVIQPVNTTVASGRSADLRVDADGNDLTLTYQWLREGQPLSNDSNFHGVTTDELSIDEVTAATEGLYSVRISNPCGVIVSNSALVFVEGHNLPPTRVTPCTADFDNNGTASVDDIFIYINAWFSSNPRCDVDADQAVTIDDIFIFLDIWFAGCP